MMENVKLGLVGFRLIDGHPIGSGDNTGYVYRCSKVDRTRGLGPVKKVGET
jgi:hypothetical protein